MKLIEKLHSRVDNVYLLFTFFVLLLLFLFFYLLQGDRHIRHYDEYRQVLQEMNSLEHRLDSIFFKKYRYLDHDETSRISKQFDEKISFLKKSALKKEFGEHIYGDFMAIKKAYDQKNDLLIRFETVNANLTNSIHTMYDLKREITRLHKNDAENLDLINGLFFQVGKIYMGLPYDKAMFNNSLALLKVCSSKDKLYQYLCLHIENFAANVTKLNAIIEKNSHIRLASKIIHLSNEMNLVYNDVREEQKMIGIGFFVLAFLMLFLLILSYIRVKKNAKELLAFRYAIENSDNVIVITDAQRHIEYVNDAFELRTGYKKEEVLGENPNILKSDLVSPEIYKNLNETLDSGEKWQGELINKRKDGSLIYEKVSIVPIFMDGELIQYLAIKLDVTAYIRQQKILQQAATVYENIGDGIVITDENKKIISINPAFSDLFGYTKEELVGKEPMIIMSLKEDKVFYGNMWHQLLTAGRWSGRVENVTKDGKVLPVWLTIAVVRNEKQDIQNYIAIYTNLEEIIKMETKANYLAYHDSLTGLPNRSSFEMRINEILSVADIEKDKIAVLFIDLDRFKVINDTLGHHIGDEMLIELAHRIQTQLDNDTLLARIGGDEFVVIMKLKMHKKEAGEQAEKLLDVIREPIDIQNYHLNTTASIGIAIYPDDGKDKNEIVKHADSAMYHAKEKGKDTFQFYTKQLSLDVEARLNLEQELLHAIERKELLLHFQPQYALESRNIIGVEALLRWKNEQLGIVSPEKFIGIAEETGLIVSIGYFVFEEACKTYMHWQKEGIDIDSISINMSSIQFREEDIFERLQEIILRIGIPAHKIEIEITERFIMEYSTINLTILEDLRNIGCKISIDDFGTGYSSMSYLKRLALDTIKIDKSFITDLPHDSHDAMVSKAIIALSKSLGYQVIAEGIETPEQEAFLKKNGCDIGQGFYFAKPMTSEDFISFFNEYKQNKTIK
ncbi:EAL domain-containing protein [Sulfurovum sp. NBC37-1]|uniref:EAL domain-containing protein n=1 Tax=Sulfurovum sp. (strain NBC37-1) TaxID=387093 RepID=UPI0001587C8A|nr:EAL domain-containing protein [Sulfurovum sp. NBC37-1]BAF72576.1 signal transduction protein [Sulfurovum sp. NBC37-1]